MRNPGIIHFFVEGGQVVVDDFVDLGGSLGNQRHQFGQFFFLLATGRGCEVVEIFHQVLNLRGKRVGFPFERRAGIAEALLFALIFGSDNVYLFLELVG